MNKIKPSKFLSLLTKIAKKLFRPIKRLVTDNPVLVSGLSLGPIVAISQSLKAGFSLSAAFCIIIVPVLVIFGFIPVKLSKSMRIILAALLSCIFFVPALWFAQTIFPEVNDKVGVFLPLMVVNPIINVKSADAANGYKPFTSMKRGIETAISFSLVMCFVSALREILGKGTIWDAPISTHTGNFSFQLPFMGFILVGLLAAGVKSVSILMSKKEEARK